MPVAVADQPTDSITPTQLEQARASAHMLGVVLLCGMLTWLAVGVVVLERLIG